LGQTGMVRPTHGAGRGAPPSPPMAPALAAPRGVVGGFLLGPPSPASREVTLATHEGGCLGGGLLHFEMPTTGVCPVQRPAQLRTRPNAQFGERPVEVRLHGAMDTTRRSAISELLSPVAARRATSSSRRLSPGEG